MKHYGAVLTGDNNIIDGGESSILRVGDSNDAFIIGTPNISGSTFDSNTSTWTHPTAGGLSIESLNGETHVLGADGREIAVASIATGGTGATYNSILDRLPVLGHTSHGAFEWENSFLIQTGGTTRTVTTQVVGILDQIQSAGGNASVTLGALNTPVPAVNNEQNDAAELQLFLDTFPMNTWTPVTFRIGALDGTPIPGSFYRTNALGGWLSRSVGQWSGANVNAGVVLDLASTDIGNHDRVEFSDISGTPSPIDVHVTGRAIIGLADTGATAFDDNIGGNSLVVSGNALVTGNLEITGEVVRTEVTENTLIVQDKYIVANAGQGAAPTANGGMLVELATPVNQQSNAAPAAPNTLGTHAGIRFTEGVGWQISNGTTASGGVVNDWASIGTADAGVDQIVGQGGLTIAGTAVPSVTGAFDGDVTISLAVSDDFLTNRGEDLATGANDATVVSDGTGLLVLADNRIKEPKLATKAIAAGTAGFTGAGAAAPTAGQVLAFADAADGTFTWVNAAEGTVSKGVFTGTKGAAATSFTITVAQINTALGTTADEDLIISVYEAITTGGVQGYSQILPESIVINDGNGATGDAGDVVITTGATTAALAYKVIIKG